jgi:hypothetical protein
MKDKIGGIVGRKMHNNVSQKESFGDVNCKWNDKRCFILKRKIMCHCAVD